MIKGLVLAKTPRTVTYEPPRCLWCRKPNRVFILRRPDFDAWWDGLIFAKDAFPTMSAENREVLISGTHPSCWNEMFPEEDEDDPPPIYLIDDEPTKGPDWEWPDGQ